ncbi:MAG: sulfite exporter TauE/SafE family protein [Pseudomonadales bacterium]|nr:sulfite exporter TauE/SafE family protein [Pseudomonadales bacterium]
MDVLQLGIAFLLGMVATFMFVATGGVGLITTPGLIFLGLPPQAAIATDLFAMLGGRLGGLVGFRKTNRLDLALGFRLSAISAAEAVVGAHLLLAIDQEVMRRVLGVMLVVMLVFLVARPAVGTQQDGKLSTSRVVLGHALFFFVGLWGTLIGAGVISLGSAVLLFIFKKEFLESAALLSLIGLAIGGAGMLIFGYNDAIDWWVGVVLMAGKFLGGYAGSLAAVRVGNTWIRRLFILVVLVSAILLNL